MSNNFLKPITAPLGNTKSNSSNQLDTNPYLLAGLSTAAATFLNNSNNNSNLPSY